MPGDRRCRYNRRLRDLAGVVDRNAVAFDVRHFSIALHTPDATQLSHALEALEDYEHDKKDPRGEER